MLLRRPWRGVLGTTLYDKVCQWLETGYIVESGIKHHNPNSLYYDYSQHSWAHEGHKHETLINIWIDVRTTEYTHVTA